MVFAKIIKNVFPCVSLMLLIPLITSICLNIGLFASKQYYLLSFMNLITDVVFSLILSFLFANPKNTMIFMKYLFISSVLFTIGTLTNILEWNENINVAMKISCMLILICGHLIQYKSKIIKDKTNIIKLISVLCVCLSVAVFFIGIDLVAIYWVVKRISFELSHIVLFAILLGLPIGFVIVLNFYAAIDCIGRIQKTVHCVVFTSYFFYVFLIYITTRYRSIMNNNYLMPCFQVGIWIHYMVVTISLLVLAMKNKLIVVKDTKRIQKKTIKLESLKRTVQIV